MADIKKTVEVIFKGTDDISQSVGSAAGSVRDFTTPLADAAANVLKLNTALAAMGAGGLVFAFNKAKEFESSLLDLKKIIGDQPEQLQAAQRVALDLSNTYGTASTDILESVAAFKQAGFALQDAFYLAEQAQKAVIAGDIGVGRATDLMVSSLAAFDAEAKDIAPILDIINSISEETGANFEKIATGFSLAAPAAAAANLTYEDTAAIVAQMAEVFQSGEIAGRALGAGLGKLIDDSAPVKDALKSIGVSQRETNGDLRAGGDIFKDLAVGMQDLDKTQQLYISNQIFGIDHGKKFVLALRDISETSRLAKVGLDGVGSSLEKEVNTRLQGSEIAAKRFSASFGNMAIVIGKEYDKSLASVITKGTKLNQVLQEQIEAGKFDEIFAFISSSIDKVGDALENVSTDLPDALNDVDLEGFVDALDSAGDAILDLFDISKEDFQGDGLSGFIQGTIDALTAIINVGAGVTRGIEPVVDSIKLLVEALSALSPTTIKGIGIALGASFAVDKAAGVVGGTSNMASAFSQLGLKLKDIDPSKLKAMTSNLKTVGAAGLALAAGTLAINAFFDSLNSNLDKQNAASKANTDESLANIKATRADIVTAVQEQFAELGGVYEGGWEGIGELTKQGLVDITGQGTGTLTVGVDDSKLRDFIKQGDLKKATADFIAMNAPADEAGKAIDDFGDKAIDGGEKLKKAEEDSENFRATLAKISSDERIKSFEFAADIKTAQIDADAQKVVASFDSISDSIASTSGSLSSLFDAFTSDDLSLSDKFLIESNIDEQTKLQKESLELQRQLIEAELERQRLINKQIAEGGGLIKIDSTGLEPALEMIMFQVLEKVQIRATEQGLPLLLGI